MGRSQHRGIEREENGIVEWKLFRLATVRQQQFYAGDNGDKNLDRSSASSRGSNLRAARPISRIIVVGSIQFSSQSMVCGGRNSRFRSSEMSSFVRKYSLFYTGQSSRRSELLERSHHDRSKQCATWRRRCRRIAVKKMQEKGPIV